MASSSKLIKLWRQGQRQHLPKWGCSCSRSLYFSSTTQTTHQILPPKTPSLCTSGETLTPMFKRASSSSSSVDTYYPEILKSGMDSNIQEMENLFCKITMVEGREEKAFHGLLDSFVTKDKFKAALLIFDFIWKKKHDNLQHPQVVIPICSCTTSHLEQLNNFNRYMCHHNRIDLALHQFQRMSHQNSSCPPNVKTFETLIYGLVAKGMVEECVMVFNQLFEHLQKTGCMGNPPFNRDFYAVALSFLGKCNEPCKVSQLFKMMKYSGFYPYEIDQSSECVCSIGNIYLNTVRGFCNLWRFEEAAQFLDEHRFGSPRVPLSDDGYTILFQAYCDAGRLDNANDLLEKMVRENIGFSCDLWKDLIRRFCEQDSFDKAFDVLKRMIAYWDKKTICHNFCIKKTSTGDDLVPPSKKMHALTDLIWHNSVNDNHRFYGLTLYITLVTGAWKEGYKCEEVYHATYGNADRLDGKNSLLEDMIKIGAGHVDYYAAHLELLCQKGAMYEACRDLHRMISLWDTECANRTCTNQTSTGRGSVPNLEPYLSLPDMIMSSLNECCSKSGDVFLGLAIYIMLNTGVWKEGHKIDAGKIVWNGATYVPKLPEIKPKWKLNGGKLVPEPYI